MCFLKLKEDVMGNDFVVLEFLMVYLEIYVLEFLNIWKFVISVNVCVSRMLYWKKLSYKFNYVL